MKLFAHPSSVVVLALVCGVVSACGFENKRGAAALKPVSAASTGGKNSVVEAAIPQEVDWRQVPGAVLLCDDEANGEKWIFQKDDVAMTGHGADVQQLGNLVKYLIADSESPPLAVVVSEIPGLALTKDPRGLPNTAAPGKTLKVSARKTSRETHRLEGKRMHFLKTDMLLRFYTDGTGTYSIQNYTVDQLGNYYREQTIVSQQFSNCEENTPPN